MRALLHLWRDGTAFLRDTLPAGLWESPQMASNPGPANGPLHSDVQDIRSTCAGSTNSRLPGSLDHNPTRLPEMDLSCFAGPTYDYPCPSADRHEGKRSWAEVPLPCARAPIVRHSRRPHATPPWAAPLEEEECLCSSNLRRGSPGDFTFHTVWFATGKENLCP